MARIVCQVLHRPNRVTFIWSDGPASFEPYSLQDEEVQAFYQAARSARFHLGRSMVGTTHPAAALELARAGFQLYQAMFRHNANDPRAREIQNWLNDLRDRHAVTSLDMLGDVPGCIPWNTIYDQAPVDQALLSGDPAALRPFWGFQYVLGAGKRVNPLRVACVLDSPHIVLAADPELMDKLPPAQRSMLGDWAIAHELTILDSVASLQSKLLEQAPDILYLYARVERGLLRLGGESVTIQQVRELLSTAKEGNPDPIVFLQGCGDADMGEAWECFLTGAVNTLAGVVMCEVPASPELVNALGVEALRRLLQNQGLGQALKEARGSQGLAALAYSAFCPTHVKAAGDNNTDPDVPGPEPLPLPDSPYRPLAPFESEDRGLFTGREDDTVRCASLLDEAATHGLVLHGAGGVGKTSFLRAGLIPHLETEAVGYLALRDRTPEDQVQRESDYPVVALRPGVDLLGQLAEALCVFCAQPFTYTTPAGNRVSVDLPGMLRATLEGVPATAIAAAPPRASETVGSAVSSAPLPAPAVPASHEKSPLEEQAVDLWRLLEEQPDLLAGFLDDLTRRLPFELVLVLEQGEDLVLQVTKSATRRRQHALETLGSVLRSAARCKVILAVRTECFGRLLEYFPSGPERWRGFFLDELGKESMLRAVLWPTAAEPVPYSSEIPRQKYQFTFDQDLAGQVVNGVMQAARDRQRSPLPLLQVVCADLRERMNKRKDDLITKADRKDQGPPVEAVVRYVNKRIRDLPVVPADRLALRGLMAQLYLRHTDGTITRNLLPTREVAASWTKATPLDTVLDAAAQAGLIDVNQMLVDGRPDLFLSLPQELLAQVAAEWDDDRKLQAFGRTRIIDTLWIMIPMMFLTAAITWAAMRRAASGNPDEPSARQEEVAKLQSQLELSRWRTYVGDLVRAEQAWNNDNPLLALQVLLRQQPGKQTDLRDFEWFYLWNKIQGKSMEAARQKEVSSVAVSPDGSVGASASLDGKVKLWNLVKGEVKATLEGHKGPVLAVAFSTDGKTVASAGTDTIIRLWDAAAGKDKPALVTKEQRALSGHTGEVRALAFGPEGLVSAGADKQVITWNLAAGKPARVFKEHATGVQALALAGDGKTIASAGTEPIILVHDGTKVLHTIKTHGPVSALAFAPDGKTLASGGTEMHHNVERGMIRFWDPVTGKETGAPLQHATGVFALAYVPRSKLLASAGKDNVVRLWDLALGRQVSTDKGHLGWVTSLAEDATGSTLLSGSRDGTIKVWDSLPPDVIAAHEGGAQAVLFSFDDNAVISGGQDGTIKMWSPSTGKMLAQLTGLGAVTSLAITRKGNTARLAAGTWNDKNEGDVRLWDVAWDAKSGPKISNPSTLKGHSRGVTCLAFSVDGKILASGSADQTAILWDMESGRQKSVLKGHDGEVRCVAFPREDDQVGIPPILMTGGVDGKIRQWDARSGTEYRPPLQAHDGPVNAVGYFFGIVGFITAGEDHTTRFWVWNPGKQPERARHSHGSNSQAVTALAFSPNRRFVAAGSLDQTVKLFDSQLEENTPTPFFAEERFTFTGLDTAIRAVAVSGNSLILAGAGDDGTIRLWRTTASREPRPE